MGQGPTKDARLHADDHTPTQKFLDCLASAFVDADVDEDGFLNRHEMIEFTRKLNGEPLGQDDIDGIFKEFGDETGQLLSLHGFQGVFVTQSFVSPSEMFKDLRTMGFDENLDPIPGSS